MIRWMQEKLHDAVRDVIVSITDIRVYNYSTHIVKIK